MCGFVFAFNFSDTGIDHKVIRSMNRELSHRGPDDEGYLLINSETSSIKNFTTKPSDNDEALNSFNKKFNIAMGHSRLSILDKSSLGHQPMISDNKNLMIVFNGEIYNFLELKQELSELGASFNSSCDTEVVLRAYEYFGKDCVHKFNGMWAFIIVDVVKKEIFISRDRFGKKPLLYTIHDKTIYFASEANSFSHIPGFKFEENSKEIKHFLNHGCTEWKKETVFKNVYRFNYASNLIININDFNGKIIEAKYWKIKVNSSKEAFDINKAKKYANEYYNLLYDAVRLRLRSDVPIGSALSGGIDSSSIVFIVNEILKEQGKTEKQNTFSSVYNQHAYIDCDESKFIDNISNSLNVSSHKIEPTFDDILSSHSNIIRSMETLTDDTALSGYQTYKLTKREGITVTLDGQGADEQLGGYLHYFHQHLASCKLSEIFPLVKGSLKVPGAKPFVYRGVILNLVSKLFGRKIVQKIIKIVLKRNFYFDLNDTLKSDTEKALVNLLYNCDRQSMAHSVESRLPFMDYRLVEFNFNPPEVYKIHDGWTKYISRLAFNGRLPDEICWRKDKMGWPVPEKAWFDGPLKAWYKEEVEGSMDFLIKHGVGKNEFIYDSKKNKRMMRILNVSRWHKLFIENKQ